MKSFTQVLMGNKWLLRFYESKIYPKFLSSYAKTTMSHEIVYDTLGSLSPDTKEHPKLIIDMCCGTGWFSRKLARKPENAGARILAFDLSKNAIEIAQQQSLMDSEAMTQPIYIVADVLKILEKIDSSDVGKVDEIWIGGALHQVGDADKLLENIAVLLADNGVIFIQTFSEPDDYKDQVDLAVMRKLGHHVFHPHEIASLARKHGLRIYNDKYESVVYFCTMVKEESHG